MKYHDLEMAFDALANYKRVIEEYYPGRKAEDIQAAMERIHRTLLQAKEESETRFGGNSIAFMLDVSELHKDNFGG